MEEIKRYRCIKEIQFSNCDGDGRLIDGKYINVKAGSIWQESPYMIAGGKDNIHLDREDGVENTCEWCEPLRENFGDHFEQIESIFV